MKRNPAREFVYKKLKEDITPGRFPEVDFSPLTTALYNWAGWSLGQAGPLADGQPHPEEGNGFTECPPRPARGLRQSEPSAAAPSLGTQYEHFTGPQEHVSAGRSCRASPTSATTKDTISGKVLLTLRVS